MDQTDEPGAQDEPQRRSPSREARVRALQEEIAEKRARADKVRELERQLAERRASVNGQGGGDPGAAGSQGETAPLDSRIADLHATLEAHQDRLRDYEKSLVERIADVDDDRRTTENKLQRGWQTLRDEMREGLRRQAGVLSVALGILVILFVGGFLYLSQAAPKEERLATERVQAIEARLARMDEIAEQNRLVQDSLTQVTAAVGEISSSLVRLGEEQDRATQVSLARERETREEIDAGIVERIQALESQQERILGELAYLQQVMDAPSAARRDGSKDPAAADSGTWDRSPAPNADGDREGGPPVQPETLAEPDPAPSPEPEASPEAQTLSQRGEAEQGGAGKGQSDPTGSIGAPEARMTADAQEPLAPATDPEPVADPGAVVEDTADTPPAAEPGPDAGPGLTDEGERLLVDEGTYALQLIGVYNRGSLNPFALAHELPDRLFLREETLRGRPWYVLIHSLHESYDSAAEALTRLPPDLRALDIWIRPLEAGMELEVVRSWPGDQP